MATNGNFNHQDQYKATGDQYPSTVVSTAPIDTSEQSSTSGANHDLPKDEVGWYFVEQYYTTLSKSPEKLHLFYGKKSQFVFGMEAEVANVAVGRQAIQERIKQLDFQDCKVRVSNVDSLPSSESIVIQVIGETSNKSEEPKKFVQTFVLAKQPSGYFVLNDIWRYIHEPAEEETAEAAAHSDASPDQDQPPAAGDGDKAEETFAAPPESHGDEVLGLDSIDKKLEEVSTTEKEETVGDTGDVQDAASEVMESTHSPEETEPAIDPEDAAQELAEEDAKLEEKPKDPTPSPAAPVAAPAAPAPAPEPEKPAKPMTWASRAAAAAGPPRPVVPLPKTATPPAATPARAPVPAPKPPAPTASQRTEPAAQETPQSASEWQTAGGDSKRQNRPQSISAMPAVEKDGTMGYVKYVTEKVLEADLRAALSSFGPLSYFDINRMKNCAFVEFQTPEGYRAAVAANPHVVNGENIVVEPRKPKATAYGGTNYAGNRGNLGQRGRGGFDGVRQGSHGSRGSFGQGRGRGGAPRGKGLQVANP